MAKGRIHRPLALARWGFLALLLIVAAWVFRLYLEGRRGPEEPPRTAVIEPPTDGSVGEAVLAAEGFEYDVSEDGEKLFSIQAARMRSDRQDRYGLEEVELFMDREGDDHYEIVSQRATYELATRDARLTGQVVLRGPDGLALRGEGFDLRQKGRVLVSTVAPASFELPGGFRGTAREVRLNIHRRHVVLAGAVSVRSKPGVEPQSELLATRMSFNQDAGLLRASGNVRLRRAGDLVSCRRMSAELGDDGEGLRFVLCNWDVAGRLEQGESSARLSTVGFSSRKLAVDYGPAGREARRVELEGSGEEPAELVLDDGTGRRRTVRSTVITATLSDGAVESVETLSAATLEEALARRGSTLLRRLCGNSLAASFTAGGDLARLALDGQVSYEEDGTSAHGARLIAAGEERLELEGSPAQLLSERGEVEAPRIVYSKLDGSVRASGGVVASSQERAGVDLAVASGGNSPVRVNSREAVWTEKPDLVVFDGKVRAWQGENFLLADRLEAPGGGERLRAEGSVKTVWKPAPGDEPRAPIEVNAGQLDYRRGEGKLRYTEQVRAHEAGRTMRCSELDLLLDGAQEIERLLCRGDSVVEDPRAGRVIRGSEADYDPAERKILFTGEPVVLRDRDGTEIRGRRLRYDLESGETQVLSEPRPDLVEPANAKPPPSQSPVQNPPTQPPVRNDG